MKKNVTTLNCCWNCRYCHLANNVETEEIFYVCSYDSSIDEFRVFQKSKENIKLWYDNHTVNPDMICKNHTRKIE